MARLLTYHSEQLSKEFVRLERTRRKVEGLYTNSLLTARDVERVYEGLFMKTVVSLESVLEEAFIGILSGKLDYSRGRISPRIRHIDKVTATNIVLGGKPFVQWLPFEHTQNRAKIYFKEGAPFNSLSEAQKTSLAQIVAIRNAIAHPSESARKVFANKVIGDLPVLRSESTPAGYLRSVYRSSPSQTRFEDLAGQCLSVAQTICK